ncbi:hypothetical protein SCAPIOD30069 [Staphylococcus capitis]|nr:hypothetical protein CR01_160069 [Staphylococcus capitis CR01]CQD28514.1 hypothetical protein SCAPIOD30069 [Staphylococcus capitis]CQD29615.1 hypothetical protein SCAPIOD70022 [Staphylococcus capitis]CQD32241.1 hypothetical protein SCAPIOD30069 [Staphylococcus capitis]CRN11826.1 hypothetical protein BN151740069 [Staphylococcus capitis]
MTTTYIYIVFLLDICNTLLYIYKLNYVLLLQYDYKHHNFLIKS